jgi:hypothetical protein
MRFILDVETLRFQATAKLPQHRPPFRGLLCGKAPHALSQSCLAVAVVRLRGEQCRCGEAGFAKAFHLVSVSGMLSA